eukprot:gene2079-1260_t
MFCVHRIHFHLPMVGTSHFISYVFSLLEFSVESVGVRNTVLPSYPTAVHIRIASVARIRIEGGGGGAALDYGLYIYKYIYLRWRIPLGDLGKKVARRRKKKPKDPRLMVKPQTQIAHKRSKEKSAQKFLFFHSSLYLSMPLHNDLSLRLPLHSPDSPSPNELMMHVIQRTGYKHSSRRRVSFLWINSLENLLDPFRSRNNNDVPRQLLLLYLPEDSLDGACAVESIKAGDARLLLGGAFPSPPNRTGQHNRRMRNKTPNPQEIYIYSSSLIQVESWSSNATTILSPHLRRARIESGCDEKIVYGAFCHIYFLFFPSLFFYNFLLFYLSWCTPGEIPSIPPSAAAVDDSLFLYDSMVVPASRSKP